MINKIACSYFNAAAIDSNNDLYVWGSIQSGILGVEQTKAQEIPKKHTFDKINLFYKASQVSCGPGHIAVVVVNNFLEKIDTHKYIDPIFKGIIKKQADALRKLNLDVIPHFNLAVRPFVPREDLVKIITKLDCHYSHDEHDELQNFIDSYCTDDGQEANLLQYFYHLNKDIFETNKVVTWGLNDNGRLGHGVFNKENENEDENLIEQILEDDEENEIEELNKKIDKSSLLKGRYRPAQTLDISSAIKKVACGHKFTVALDTEGFVWTWGKGSNGCLGTGNLGDACKPTPLKKELFGLVHAENMIVDIAAGSEHCLALNLEKNVFTWGNGKMGRLGHGTETSELIPTKIQFFINKGIKILQIEAGEMHSACIDADHKVFTFGCGSNFRLGHGSVSNELIPRLVTTIAEYHAVQVSCGLQHTICLTSDGYIYAWGCGLNGRLGVDMVSDKDYLLPTRVGVVNEDFKKKNFLEICAGPFQSFGLTKDGELYSWGAKKFKTLGIADLKKDIYYPLCLNLGSIKYYHIARTIKVDNEKSNKIAITHCYDLDYQKDLDPEGEPFKIIKAFCGETNTVLLMENGDIYITGSGQYGQLGLNPEIKKEDFKDHPIDTTLFWEGDLFYSHTPLYFSANLDMKFKYVAVGLHHIVAINELGKVYSWGKNTEGQLGLGTASKFVSRPTLIEELALREFFMCIASHNYSAFLSVEGQISVCGTAEYGSLGVNTIKQNYDVLIPKLVKDLPPAKYIAGGPQHMVAITVDGQVYAWGNTNNSRTGLGKGVEKALVPMQVQPDHRQSDVKFKQASCGFMHTLLLDDDGYIWGAGVKAYAGFPSDDGHRTLEEQETFTWLPDLSGIKFLQIASGEFHNLALKSTENKDTKFPEIYGWGKSEYGKLAQNTFLTLNSNDTKLKNILLPKKIEIPGHIDKVESITSVACGVNHSVALNGDGEVYTWGCVLTGRLGISVDDLKRLKRQQQIKREHNVMTLNYPKKLLTYFEDEFEVRLKEFAHNTMKDFLNLSPEAQRKADILNTKLETKNIKTNDNDQKDMLDDDQLDGDDYGNPQVLKKQFTVASPKKMQAIADEDQIHEDAVLVQDPGTAATFATGKRTESPVRPGSNLGSSLLSPPKKELDLRPPKSNLFQLTKVSPSRGTEVEDARGTHKSRQEDVDKSKSDISAAKQDTKQNYMLHLKNEEKRNKQEQLLLQRLLQEEDSETYELTLMARDSELFQNFEHLFKRVGDEVEKIRERLSNQSLEVQSIIQTSFSMMKQPLRRNKNIAHTIPSFILQNIQIYEGIISMFFIHPCYLHTIMKSNLIDSNVVLDWSFKIYGSNTQDERAMNQALALGLMMLEEEVELFPISQVSVVKLMGGFVKMYDFILMNQQENLSFLKEIAEYLLLNAVIRDHHPKFNAFKHRKSGKFELNDVDGLGNREKKKIERIEDYFNLEPYIKNKKSTSSKTFTNILKRCKQFLEKMETYLKSILSRPDFSILGKMSPQIRYFNHRILEEYRNSKKGPSGKGKKEGGFDSTGALRKAEFFVIELFFSKVSKIIVDYKNYGIKVPRQYERLLSPQNLSNLSMLIIKYFQKEEVGQKEQDTGRNNFFLVNDFINTHSKSTQVINNLIRGIIIHDDFNITLDTILKSVEDSMQIEDRINSKLSVKDIITIQNFLIRNRDKPDKIFLNGEDDPVFIMIDHLKDNERELSSFAFEMLDYKVNLRLNSKMMRKLPGEESLNLRRCNFCQLVFPEHFLRTKDIEIIKSEYWTCHKCGEKENPFTNQNCKRKDCQTLIQEYKLQQKYLFKRYIPLIKKDQPFQDYFEILKTNQTVFSDTDMMDFLSQNMEGFAKTGRFDVSSVYSKILHHFRYCIANIHSLAKDYKFSVAALDDDKKMMSFIHDIFCDEFQLRRQHKKYLDQLELALNRIYQVLAASRHRAFRMFEEIEKISIKVALNYGKYNGVVSKVLRRPGAGQEEEMKRKMETEMTKAYAMYTSVDLKTSGVLASFLLHNKVVPKIINNLRFYVFYRKNKGFNVKVVFIEDSWQNLLVRFGPWFINEVGVDEFNISTEHFMELFRTSNFKAETSLGYSTFYVENLVKLLNDVLINSNIKKIKKVTEAEAN